MYGEVCGKRAVKKAEHGGQLLVASGPHLRPDPELVAAPRKTDRAAAGV